MGDGEGGNGEVLSDEIGHDEGWGGLVGRCGEEQADGGTRDAGGSGGGVLGDDSALRRVGPGELRGCADLERGAADLDGGGTLVESDEAGDGDLLRAEAFGEQDVPSAADHGLRHGGLAGDVAGGCIHAVEVIFDGEVESEIGGFGGGLGEGESFEAGDGDFGSVNGEVHGHDGREQGEAGQHEEDEQESEGAEHPLLSVLDGVGDFGGFLEHFGDGAVFVFGEGYGVFGGFF